MPTVATTTRCTTCEQAPGGMLSRHAVSTGWITYYRCDACAGIRAVHTPRIAWSG